MDTGPGRDSGQGPGRAIGQYWYADIVYYKSQTVEMSAKKYGQGRM